MNESDRDTFKSLSRKILYYLLFLIFVLIFWQETNWQVLIFVAIAALIFILALFVQLILLYTNRPS